VLHTPQFEEMQPNAFLTYDDAPLQWSLLVSDSPN